MNPTSFLTSLTATAALFAPQPAAQSFTRGDIYMLQPAATGISTGNAGVIRFDPTTGTSTLVAGPFGSPGEQDSMAYDPYRDGLLFSTGPAPIHPTGFWRLDAAGTMHNLGWGDRRFYCLAPTGDGRIYLRQKPESPGGRVLYLDAADQIHAVFDANGTQSFEFVPGTAVNHEHMLYHAPTNALIAVARNNNPLCSGVIVPNIVVYRAPLSADGTRVVGPVECNQFDVSNTSERPVGLTRMPDGNLLLIVDTNSNQSQPRMIRIDPFTLAMSTFATNQYTGAAATNAGCFSSRLGRALILDTGNDVLRSFAFGGSGLGTVVPHTGQYVSPVGSSGEAVTMLEIRSAPCDGSFTLYGDALAGSGGYSPSFSASGCPIGGASITLYITAGLGGTSGAMLVGAARTSFPFLGGTVLVNPLFSVPLGLTGPAGVPGGGRLAIPVSIGIPGITTFTFQSLLLDPGATMGLSMTNGLELEIG